MTAECDELLALSTQRALDVLAEEDARRLEAHLVTCPTCSAREAPALLALAAPKARPEPAAATWDRLAERIREHDAALDAAIASSAGPGVAVTLHCTFCHGDLHRLDAVYCATCLAPHHGECFESHGRCSAPGCGEQHTVRPRVAVPTRRANRRLVAAALTFVLAGGAGAAAAVFYRPKSAELSFNDARAWQSFATEVENQLINVRSQLATAESRLKDHDPINALGDLNEALRILDDLTHSAEKFEKPGRAAAYLRSREDDIAFLRRRIWRLKGDTWALRESWNDALDSYREVLRHQPSTEEALEVELLIAKIQTLAPRSDELDALTAALDRNPKLVSARVQRAQIYELRHEYRKAIDDCTRALKEDPEADHARLCRGRCHFELHEYADAREDFERLLEHKESDAAVYIERGRTRAALGDLVGAEEDLTEAIDLSPSSPDGYLRRGETYLAERKLAEAIKDFEVAITRSNTCYDAYLGLARTLEETLDYERALSQYEEVLKGEDREALAARPRALAGRAEILWLLGKEGEARESFARSLEADPSFVPALVGRARLALATYDRASAVPDLVHALDRLGRRPWLKRADEPDPERATVECLLGQAALLGDDRSEARARFAAAIACDTSSAMAVAGLALSGSDDRFFLRARALMTDDPRHREAVAEAAIALLARSPRSRDHAVRALDHVVALDPYDGLAYLARARLSASSRKPRQALHFTNCATDADPSLGEAWELRGFLLGRDFPEEDRDPARAVTAFTRALEVVTQEESAVALYGRALVATGLLAEGVAPIDSAALSAGRSDVERALGTFPADVHGWLEKEQPAPERVLLLADLHELHARILGVLGHPDGAADATARAAKVRDEARLAARRACEEATALRAKRNYSDAMARADRALALDPDLAEAFSERGSCYLKMGNFVPGILDFAKAVELNPRYTDSFALKPFAEESDPRRVLAEIDKIVADHPDEAHVLFLHGSFYVTKAETGLLSGDELAKGQRDFSRAIELDSRFVAAYLYRGYLHYASALIEKRPASELSLDAAMRDYERVVELDEPNGPVHFLKALVWSARARNAEGDERKRFVDEAIRELTIAVEEKNWQGRVRIREDRGLEVVRDDPRVQKLLQGR